MMQRHQDKSASKSHGQPHSSQAQQPETMHDCGRIQGSGSSTPLAILHKKDSNQAKYELQEDHCPNNRGPC